MSLSQIVYTEIIILITSEENMLNLFSSISNKTKAIYLIWFLANLLLLLTQNSIIDIFFGGNDDFYPLDGWHLSDYDTSEFIAYIFFPVIVYAIIKLFRQK